MEPWLEVTIGIVGLLGTVLGVLGISGYISERAKHKAHKKNIKEDEAEAKEKAMQVKQLEDTFRNVYREESQEFKKDIAEVKEEISEIKHDLADNTVGTVTILRDRMKAILDDCRDAGYASTSTKGNWHELYNTYKGLGGNHFKEYVDAWKHELEELPSVKPSKRKTNTSIDKKNKI